MTLPLSRKLSDLVGRWPVRLSVVVAGVMLAAAGIVVWLGTLATSEADSRALERQVRFAANGLEEVFQAIPREQESITRLG
jgi:hypothetical protein